LGDALEELTRLTELRDAQAALSAAITELDGEDDDSILSRLARVIAQMPAGESLSSPRLQLRDALDQAREVVRELSSLADPDSLDPETSRQLEDRVSQLQQIARKYGGTVSSALEALEQLRATRQSRLDDAVRLVALDEEIERLDAREHQLALEVRAQRESAARQLNEALKSQLPRVALSQATLRFEIDGEDGSRVTILFSANRGQREGPVEALASGGELSRVLLALSLETVEDGMVTVFDEVDAGVGGQVAQQIGECLQEVGRRQQVLAVTHLATVAARADHHFVIKKIVKDHTTSTIVRSVAGDERITEIARMLAGDEITRESKALALQLLETAR
jgi:DNA repair protein RecN (Recombination protein N)